MSDGALLWLALLAAVLSLGPLFLVAWGVAGGDGEPPNALTGLLGLAIAVSAVASVVAALRAVTHAPTIGIVGVMAAPIALAILALLAAGPGAWRGDPRSRLTADDVREMGLDPAEHGFTEQHQWRGVVLSLLAVAAPFAPPLLVLLTSQVP